ncbi:NB-ARC domain-containing protein [Streptomyces sp. NBC_01006]|uniref:NB-ARC domain-containing protein n=1 Tax=Streptomyces sp. NBC_01006 TaxID=2903716 RepID=UPI0038660BCE
MVGNIPREAECFQRRDQLDLLNASNGDIQVKFLMGSGGVGKTQLAAYYARQALAENLFDVIVWASAASRESVQSAYSRAICDISGVDGSDPESTANRFLSWAQTTSLRWLVVLDNVAGPGTLSGLWPPSSATGKVLATTRRRDSALSGPSCKRIDVGLFKPTEAVRYLTSKLAAHGREIDLEEASLVSLDLGHLPLALAQCAAYLVDVNMECASYRSLLADKRRSLSKLLPDSTSLPDDHQTTVAATWSLSIEQADSLSPSGLARPALHLAAILDPSGFLGDVFVTRAGLEYLSRNRTVTISGNAQDGEIEVHDARGALQNLRKLSLIEIGDGVDGESALIRVHALVQRVVIEELEPEALAEAALAMADGLLELWPDGSAQSGDVQALRSSAEILRRNHGSVLIDEWCHELLFRHGQSLLEAGLAASAIDHFTDLRAAVEAIDPDHSDLYCIRLHQADAMDQAGDLPGALAEYESLLVDETRKQDDDAEDVLHVRSVIAEFLGGVGDSIASVRAFEELLRDRIRVQGADSEWTLDTRRRLVAARSRAGDLAGAFATCEELLEDEIRLYGRDHPHTHHTRMHLADEVAASGDMDGAIILLCEVIRDVARIHGECSEETFAARHRLGDFYAEAESFARAVGVFESLLVDQRKALGAGHPSVLEIQAHLADAIGAGGDPAAAAVISKEILKVNLIERGPRHPNTLDAQGLLWHWKGRSGEIDVAVSGFSKLLVDCEMTLGRDHPQTISAVMRFASWLRSSGDMASALLAYRRLAEDRARVHGKDDSRTLHARDCLAFHVLLMGESEQALALFRALYADQVRLMGQGHPDAVHTLEHIEDLEA